MDRVDVVVGDKASCPLGSTKKFATSYDKFIYGCTWSSIRCSFLDLGGALRSP